MAQVRSYLALESIYLALHLTTRSRTIILLYVRMFFNEWRGGLDCWSRYPNMRKPLSQCAQQIFFREKSFPRDFNYSQTSSYAPKTESSRTASHIEGDIEGEI